MTADEISHAVLTLDMDEAVKERLVNELVGQMADLEMDGFSAIINDHMTTNGVDQTIMELIYPFLEKTGILWQTEPLNRAQEQLVTHIIRQKLVAAITTLPAARSTADAFLLFLPAGENLETGLLLIHYLVKRMGFNTIYLGTNVPIGDIAYVLKVKKPAYAFTQFRSAQDPEVLFPLLRKHLPGIPVLILGQVPSKYPKKQPENLHFMPDARAALDFLRSLGSTHLH
jgi:hypothetical protein